ncbi:hypothetical protein LGH82_12225 [Mesorhizobium sp. PAMC28654]|uniref:hypothetical protein n=1 Tax=Mesorhizobium sp. PAMC28654 TaxID=2880934 RepID=UPI001D0A2C56|nr:hypothetical protein [Mesorhizobium sp. PAMC28654]UDL91932.1 hypothetical protein LGH82_12225 [Mesorhizobium sp. PAMC28654]
MADALTVAPPSRTPPLRRWRDFRLIPAFDKDARAIALAQTRIGRLLLFAIMLVLARGDLALTATIGFGAAVAYLPRRRALLMIVATVSLISFGPMLAGGSPPSPIAVVDTFSIFAFTAILLAIARRTGRRGPFARPVPTLFVAIGALATLGSLPMLGATFQAIVWSAATTLAASMWFIAYALANTTGRQAKPAAQHLGVLHPFWGSTTVPSGKGAAYLAKFEARTDAELAVTQIKAAKLLLWAKLLLVAGLSFHALMHVQGGIPTLAEAVAALAADHPWSRTLSIEAIPVDFIDNLFSLAVMGHVFVACCRYAGFRIPRNMCRPLEAQSIAEFWNRYYFYFKELLVDFFFLPAFSRLQGWPARMRVLAATFCAAGLGNYLFHFFRDIDLVRTLGPAQAIIGSQTYAFYCLLLSLGIACSQLIGATSASSQKSSIGRIASRFRVIGFYCLVSLFAYDGRTLTLQDHFHFLFYVLGITA